jgi:hypothetical protein
MVRWKRLGLQLVGLALAGFVLEWATEVGEGWWFARDAAQNNRVAVMPSPLPDLRVDELKDGAVVDGFGYSLRFPATKVVMRHEFNALLSVGFEGGASVLLMNPEDTKELSMFVAGDAEQRRAMGQMVGSDAVSSKYAMLSAELCESPKEVKFFQTRFSHVREMMLLNFKQLAIPQGTTAIYAVTRGEMRGFQIGDPRTSRIVKLELFDDLDRQIELILREGNNAPLGSMTQAQINGVIASVQRVNEGCSGPGCV